MHCKCLQGITGCPRVFPVTSMEKGCKNHRETLHSSKGKIVYVVGNPCNIYGNISWLLHMCSKTRSKTDMPVSNSRMCSKTDKYICSKTGML